MIGVLNKAKAGTTVADVATSAGLMKLRILEAGTTPDGSSCWFTGRSCHVSSVLHPFTSLPDSRPEGEDRFALRWRGVTRH